MRTHPVYRLINGKLYELNRHGRLIYRATVPDNVTNITKAVAYYEALQDKGDSDE